MPLPTDKGTAWPPVRENLAYLQTWAAWYSGVPARMATTPNATTNSGMEKISRGYWHRHVVEAQAQRPHEPQPMHVPLAAEIAAVSADLLFGEFPEFEVEDEATQKRLEEIVDEAGVQNALLEAAEYAAALGGTYLRATWDTDLSDVPFLSAMPADGAVPEFAWGVLQAVTFWRELYTDERGVILRHLERHEPGTILHGLYAGTKTTLGYRVALDRHPETEGLEEVVPLPQGFPSRIACWYVPNVRPHRAIKGYEGRSDYAGAEDELDALDEVYSSLMRDIRIGQARLIVPRQQLTGAKRGDPKTFELDKSVFVELDVGDPDSQGITASQFAVRTKEHLDACLNLVERIVSAAGYSPQTFGLHIDGQAESGTALKLREGRTAATIGRKQRYWKPALIAALEALLFLDGAVYNRRPTKTLRPSIDWREEAEPKNVTAQTATMLRTAEAASTETLVRMMNPDRDEEWVTEEVARIVAERGAILPDVITPGADEDEGRGEPTTDELTA